MTLALIALAASAAAAPAQLALQQVGTGFNQPLFLTAAPGEPNSQVYVVEKTGLIRTLNTTNNQKTTFLDLPTVLGAGQLLTGGEQGLLGMTFGPGFSNGNGFVYVDYTGNNGTTQGETRVDRFTVAGGAIQAGSRANVLTFAQNVSGATNHKAGWIGFGPDNNLYIATGDGGSGNDPNANAQNLGVHLGKMLRVTPNTGAGGGFTVPPTNPFASSPNPVTQTIFASGLRNPFRNSFDRGTGNLYIGDVGQNTREEVNFVPAGSNGGQNFGWRKYEGNILTPGITDTLPNASDVTFPVHDYPHTNGNATVTGGYVYRGGDIFDTTTGQTLDGTYIFGDYISGRVFSTRYSGTGTFTVLDRTTELNSIGVLGGSSLASFGEDNLGRLYFIDIGGQVYRLSGTPIPEPGTLALCGLTAAGGWLWRRRRVRTAETN